MPPYLSDVITLIEIGRRQCQPHKLGSQGGQTVTVTRPPSFRRDLSEFMTVSVDGNYDTLDPDITDRAPGRVVIAMPDFTADAWAHVLRDLARIAELLDTECLGLSPQELAQALSDAAASTGVHCPDRAREHAVS